MEPDALGFMLTLAACGGDTSEPASAGKINTAGKYTGGGRPPDDPPRNLRKNPLKNLQERASAEP